MKKHFVPLLTVLLSIFLSWELKKISHFLDATLDGPFILQISTSTIFASCKSQGKNLHVG